ncbi:hypothetical protein MMC28_003940 [Mycoblastus sanguinarius]|nr:hypothetical protein [Mycoblastus sanguinarius]
MDSSIYKGSPFVNRLGEFVNRPFSHIDGSTPPYHTPYRPVQSSFTVSNPPQTVPIRFESIPPPFHPQVGFRQNPGNATPGPSISNSNSASAAPTTAHEPTNGRASDPDVQITGAGKRKSSQAKNKGPPKKKPQRAKSRQKTPTGAIEVDDDEQSDPNDPRPPKQGRGPNMKRHKKLVLIRECCEHRDDYRPLNKTAFWNLMSRLLEEKTGYKLAQPRNTVTRWVEARVDELIEEEMGSRTEEERGDFKAAVELFAEHMDAVAEQVQDAAKTQAQKAQEAFETGRLENSMVFKVDDEAVPGFDAP